MTSDERDRETAEDLAEWRPRERVEIIAAALAQTRREEQERILQIVKCAKCRGEITGLEPAKETAE